MKKQHKLMHKYLVSYMRYTHLMSLGPFTIEIESNKPITSNDDITNLVNDKVPTKDVAVLSFSKYEQLERKTRNVSSNPLFVNSMTKQRKIWQKSKDARGVL